MTSARPPAYKPRNRVKDGHRWPWWTAAGVVVAAGALVVSFLAWRYPQAPRPAGPGPGLTVEASILGEEGWRASIATGPSRVLVFRVRYADGRGVRHNAIGVKVDLPQEVIAVHQSTTVFDGANPDGYEFKGFPLAAGIVVGDHAPFHPSIEFAVKVKDVAAFNCVARTLRFKITITAGDQSAVAEPTATVTKVNC